MYLTYEADKEDKFNALSFEKDSSHFYTKHITDCSQKEELITIDDKNYILVSSYANNEVYALYEMKRNESKMAISEQVCDFVPTYGYE